MTASFLNLPLFSQPSFIPYLVLGLLLVAAFAFVAGALIWLKKLRSHLAKSVGDALARQIQHGNKVEDTITAMRAQQRQMEGHIQKLAEALAQTRLELNAVNQRLERQDSMADPHSSQGRILH